MKVLTIGQQRDLFGGVRPIQRHVFDVPIAVLRKLAEGERHECVTCGAPIYEHAFSHVDNYGPVTFEYYLGPWDNESQLEYYCTEHREDSESQTDVSFCEYCEREICNSNGARSYFKYDEDYGQDMCVACWQRSMLAYDEQAKERIDAFASGQKRKLPCDFFNWDELSIAGFARRESFFLDSDAALNHLRQRIRVYQAEGLQVLLDQGPTSYMGDEGHVDIWVRLAPSDFPEAADTTSGEET